MEVHHHPHVAKKNFKEYLLEGLMIFLAVTMGFIAENIREHFIDRERERDYVESLVVDLKAVTTELNYRISKFNTICENLDTMLMILRETKPDAARITKIIANNYWSYSGYSYNNRTLIQLKNSGSFRFLHNKLVSDSILMYDNHMNSIVLNQYADLKTSMFSYKDIETKVIHSMQLTPDANAWATSRINPADFAKEGPVTFVSDNRELLDQYYNKLFLHLVLTHTFIQNLEKAKQKAIGLLLLIVKEYHIKNEE